MKSLENSKIHMQGNLNERKTFQKNPKEQVTIEDSKELKETKETYCKLK